MQKDAQPINSPLQEIAQILAKGVSRMKEKGKLK
jgi:hypothetical protein